MGVPLWCEASLRDCSRFYQVRRRGVFPELSWCSHVGEKDHRSCCEILRRNMSFVPIFQDLLRLGVPARPGGVPLRLGWGEFHHLWCEESPFNLPPFSLPSLSFPLSVLVRAKKSSMNEFAFHVTLPSIKIAESNGIEPVALM